MKFLPLPRVFWVLLFWTATVSADNTASLDKSARQHLDTIASLRPGMTEKQLRARIPDMENGREEDDYWSRKGTTLTIPNFHAGGVDWEGRLYLSNGKLRGLHLTSVYEPTNPDGTFGPKLSRADARELKRTIMQHFASHFGERPEIHAPLMECNAGNPYTLCKTWSWPSHVLFVEYFGASGTGYVEIFLWETKDWNDRNKETYGDLWPFRRR